MCVIAVKRRGFEFPNADSIKAMWDTNSDGAGFMYMLNGKVIIEKGFMKLTDFNNAIATLDKKLRKARTSLADTPIVLHFRITTHGGTSAELTHPFPISSQEEHLKALDVTCDLGLVHNGIINAVPSQAGLSDTAVYIANVLTPLANMKQDFYKTKEGKTIMENTIGASKFAFLDKHGNIELVGHFKEGTKNDTSGLLFSNLNHEFDASAFRIGSTINYFPADTSCEWDEFEDSVIVKKLPVGTLVANSTNFFESADADYMRYTKVLNEVDSFYMDKNSTIYTKNTLGRFIESRYYDTMLSVVNDVYTYGYYEELPPTIKEETIKVPY